MSPVEVGVPLEAQHGMHVEAKRSTGNRSQYKVEVTSVSGTRPPTPRANAVGHRFTGLSAFSTLRRGETENTEAILRGIPHDTTARSSMAFKAKWSLNPRRQFTTETGCTNISDVSQIIQYQTRKSVARRAKLVHGVSDEESYNTPVVQIVATSVEECEPICEKVCLAHTCFLMHTILPHGGKVEKEEDLFTVKSFLDFQELHKFLLSGENNWDIKSNLTHVPNLPAGKVPRVSILGLCRCGEKFNPRLEEELQHWINVVTSQVADLASVPDLQDFLVGDRIQVENPATW